MPETTPANPFAEIQMPTVSQWQKALPMIFSLATAILTSLATHNFAILGAESLKDIPSILQTLGFGGGAIVGAIGTLWSFLHNNRKTATAQLITDLQTKMKSILSGASGIDASSVGTFLTDLQAVIPSRNANQPALLLPGFSLTLDPATFGKPDSDARKKLVDSIAAFLSNLEPKPAPTA